MPYAVERFTAETKRLYGVLDTRLREVEYLTGGIYGMSDIATFPWLRSWEMQGMRLGDYPQLERWFNAVAARPAVQRGIAVLADQKRTQLSDAERDVLFGARAATAQSAVLLPIGTVGMLAIGSLDPNRFHPGMGTVFLKLIGEAVSTALARFPVG